MPSNPLQLVYQAIWSMLEAQSDFATLVPAANRVKYSGTLIQASDKETLSPSDYPYVRVLATAMQPHLERTSNGSSLKVLWKIEISTGERQLTDLFAVEWAIYQAMAFWRTHVEGLDMEGDGYVVLCRPAAVRTQLGDPTIDRGARGWSSVWAGISLIWFATASLGT